MPELRELWDLSETADTWEGITFDEDGVKGKVISIELDDMDISGGRNRRRYRPGAGRERDALVVHLPLEECYLSNNLLKSVPKEIGDLDNLETLWLNNNCLKKLPKEIGNLSALETLDVSENELTTLPKELADCELLEQPSTSTTTRSRASRRSWRRRDLLEAQGCNVVREPLN